MNYCTYRTWITVLLCKPQISTAPSFNSTCLFIITLVLPLQKLLRDVWLQHYLDCLQRWMKIPGKQSVISSTQHLEPQTGKWWLQPMECSQRFQPDLLVLREVFLGIGLGSKSGKQTEEIDKLKWYTKGNFYLPLRRLILKKERAQLPVKYTIFNCCWDCGRDVWISLHGHLLRWWFMVYLLYFKYMVFCFFPLNMSGRILPWNAMQSRSTTTATLTKN